MGKVSNALLMELMELRIERELGVERRLLLGAGLLMLVELNASVPAPSVRPPAVRTRKARAAKVQ